MENMSDMDKEVAHKFPINMYRKCYEYYVEICLHSNSRLSFLQGNLMDLIAYDPLQFMHLIDQPLLMIFGDKADTQYMSADAYNMAFN